MHSNVNMGVAVFLSCNGACTKNISAEQYVTTKHEHAKFASEATYAESSRHEFDTPFKWIQRTQIFNFDRASNIGSEGSGIIHHTGCIAGVACAFPS